MKTDKTPANRGKSSRKKPKDEHFDDVDKRIQIPVATRMKMQMNLKMGSATSANSGEDTRLLRSGIDQYRSLQQLNTSTPRKSRGSAERAIERALSLMERRQFAAAAPYFTEALELMTSSSGSPINEVTASNFSTVKLFHQRGLCYLAAKKFKPAIEDLSKVMQMTPKSAELYAKRGKAYAALGEHHAAMLDYNEAINLAATQGLLNDCGNMESDGRTSSSASLVQLRGLYLARAKVYKAMNNITHALGDLSQAESSAGGHRDLELFYERAQLYLQCHQDSLALKDFDRYLELQEEAEENRHFDASGGVGGLAGFGAPMEMEAEPKARMLDVLLERAKLLQRMALEEDARERKDVELQAVEQGQNPRKPEKSGVKATYTSVPPKPEPYRGIESRRLEKRALHDYTRALELDSSNAETLRLRGESLMHLARYDDALADFATALELDPHDFQVCMARAKLYRQRGDLNGAVEEVTAVLRVNGFFINGLKLRAQLYEELGEIANAEGDYSSIIHAHFDKPGLEDAAASGKVTMELASGGTVNLGGKSATLAGKTAKSRGKITSEVAAQALLCRARLRMASEQFDAAEEDYQAILKSFANNMEAQLELQETRERKVTVEERKQREALAWLEQNADELDNAGVLNANGNATSGKSKKKKKKKKKKKANNSNAASEANASGKAPAGYVLLEDEEELLQQRQVEEQRRIQEEQKPKQVASEKIAAEEVSEPEQGSKGAETETLVDSEAIELQTTEAEAAAGPESSVSLAPSDEAPDSDALEKSEIAEMPVAKPPPPVVVANVMTRDEAWESMWDEEADEPLEAGAVRIHIRAQSGDVVGDEAREASPSVEDVPVEESGEDEDPTSSAVELPAADVDDEASGAANDEASGSSDDGKEKAKTVLVDEKYLKKREKQLKKLRTSLQHASDERDKTAIDEALARAERKQMSDALEDDIKRARGVLADMAAEAQRSREALPPSGSTTTPAPTAEHGRMHLHAVTPTTSPSGSSKHPSLVIRPIAYGQALQAAEQHQQQLRAHQKLIEEKDAEIAQLKLLLAQKEKSVSATAPQEDGETRVQAKTAALTRRVTRLRTHFPAQGAAARQADTLIEWMGPSEAADRVRQQVLSFVQRVITAHFPMAAAPLFFATGSYPMKTYLPGSDLDICLLVPQELESSWYFIVTQALCIAGGSGGAGTVLDIGNAASSVDGSGSGSPSTPGGGAGAVGSSGGALLLTNTVRNVTFINADVRVVKCTVDNIPVDFTANRVGALGAVRLLDAMAVRVGRQHLFKKSLILIKAWCTHESSPFVQAASTETGGLGPSGVPGNAPSSVMGASHGALSTYAVNTIVMALFNQHGDALTHPLQVLYMFLDRLAEFPWHEAALTLHGAVPLSRLATTPVNGATPSKSKLKAAKLDAGDVEAIRDTLADQFGAFDASLRTSKGGPSGLFPIRACNIVDPLDDKNNLARSVSAEGFPIMKRAFRLARDQLAAMLAPRSSPKDEADAELLSQETGSDVGSAFFSRCWQLYGRGDGWRPDLLIHPRQVWHGKAASTSSSGSTKKNKASPRPRAASASPTVQQTSDDDEDRRWESLLPTLEPGAVNALLIQHQQLQQQAAAAAAYHHGTMIAYQQPYYGPPMGSPGPTPAIAGSSDATSAEPLPYYQPALRRPYGSPGGGKSGPVNGKTSPPRT